jgi:hypothetical protein
MATYKYELKQPPEDARSRELWLQHAAGKIIFEDARQCAIDEIPEDVDEDTRDKIIDGINNTIYGIMQIFDKVSGSFSNSEFIVEFDNIIKLISRKDDQVIDQVDLSDGDGMCMGYHGWLEDDFGEDPIVIKKEETPEFKSKVQLHL